MRIWYFISSNQIGSDWAKGVTRLSFNPLTGMFYLKFSFAEIIDDTVSSNMRLWFALRNIFCFFSNNNTKLNFPVRLYWFFWNLNIIVWSNNGTCCFCKNNWFRWNFLTCFFSMIRVIKTNTNKFSNTLLTNTRCKSIIFFN